MDELMHIEKAKEYIEKMAQGIDPLTDAPIPDEETLNNVRIARCLFYVSSILGKIIEAGGIDAYSGKKCPRLNTQKQPFYMDNEDLDNFPFSNYPITISNFVERVNSFIKSEFMEKLKVTSATSFLVQSGMLKVIEVSGQLHKVPTDQGLELGISMEQRVSQYGKEYPAVYYNINAQHYLLDHIRDITVINTIPRKRKDTSSDQKDASTEPAQNHGNPWSKKEEDKLVELYKSNIEIEDIATKFKRTPWAIYYRLNKLGLIL